MQLMGLEPTTLMLKASCSSNWATAARAKGFRSSDLDWWQWSDSNRRSCSSILLNALPLLSCRACCLCSTLFLVHPQYRTLALLTIKDLISSTLGRHVPFPLNGGFPLPYHCQMFVTQIFFSPKKNTCEECLYMNDKPFTLTSSSQALKPNEKKCSWQDSNLQCVAAADLQSAAQPIEHQEQKEWRGIEPQEQSQKVLLQDLFPVLQSLQEDGFTKNSHSSRSLSTLVCIS